MIRINMTTLPDDEWMRQLAGSFEREAERNPATAGWYLREAATLREKLKSFFCVKE